MTDLGLIENDKKYSSLSYFFYTFATNKSI